MDQWLILQPLRCLFGGNAECRTYARQIMFKKKNSQRQVSNTGRNAIMHLASDIPCARKIPICTIMFPASCRVFLDFPPCPSTFKTGIPSIRSNWIHNWALPFEMETLPLTQQHIFHIIYHCFPLFLSLYFGTSSDLKE